MKKGKRIVLVMVALVSAVSLFAAPAFGGYFGNVENKNPSLEVNEDGSYVLPISEEEAQELEAQLENYELSYDEDGNRIPPISDEDMDNLRLYYQVIRMNDAKTRGGQGSFGSSQNNGLRVQEQDCDDCDGECTTPGFLENERKGNFEERGGRDFQNQRPSPNGQKNPHQGRGGRNF